MNGLASDRDKIRCIVGLGNPGKRYRLTRHNIGFLVVEAFLRKYKLESKTKIEFNNEVSNFNDVFFIKPLNYVNNAGQTIKPFLESYGISLNEIMVLCDDVSLKYGRIKIKPKGGSGGHKGLEGIITTFQTNEFPRMRLGIGPVPEGYIVKDFVLENFSVKEIESLGDYIKCAVEIIDQVLTKGLIETMKNVNSKETVLETNTNIEMRQI